MTRTVLGQLLSSRGLLAVRVRICTVQSSACRDQRLLQRLNLARSQFALPAAILHFREHGASGHFQAVPRDVDLTVGPG